MKDPIERQTAIDAICKSECGSGFCGIPCPEVNALKALPSAQSKTAQNISDDDLISRKAAEKCIDEALARVFVDSHGCGETALRGLPSVKLKRKRGHWVGIDDEPCETWECDQCGYVQECFDGDQPNYCPNCGVDMRGGRS